MMYPKLIENLIFHFSKLPGVGRRSAERMAFWFLDHTPEEAEELARSVVALKRGLRFCQQCNHLTDQDLCTVCNDQSRDKHMICVVEDPKDVIAFEKSGAFKGLYHVLLGTISPADGRGPEDLKINHLFERIHTEGIKEILIATDPDNDGEMTALYLINHLKGSGVLVSRIGLGLPMGSSVEFADISTLSMAIASRREIRG